MFKTPKNERVASQLLDIDRAAISKGRRNETTGPLKGTGNSREIFDDEIPEGAQFWGPLALDKSKFILDKANRISKQKEVGGSAGTSKMKRGGGPSQLGGGPSQLGGDMFDILKKGITMKKKGGEKIENGDRDPAAWDKISLAMRTGGGGVGRKVGGNVVESLGYDMIPEAPVMVRGGAVGDLMAAAAADPAAVRDAIAPIAAHLPAETRSNWQETLRTVSGVISDITPLLQLIASLKRGKGKSGGARGGLVPEQLLHGVYMGGGNSDSDDSDDSDNYGGKKRISDILGYGVSGGKKKKTKRPPTEWQKFVKTISQREGLNLPQTMKYIKEKGLWKK